MFSEPTALDLERRAWAAQEEQDRQADQAYVQKWDDFVAWLRERAATLHDARRWSSPQERYTKLAVEIGMVLQSVLHADDSRRVLLDFAATEDLDGVFRALAQAYKAEKLELREIEARR